MKTKSKLIILKKIIGDKVPTSKATLLETLEQEDIHMSLRTLERYLKELTDSFFIEYSPRYKGYIKNELLDENELQLFMHLLHVEIMSNLIVQGVQKKLVSKRRMLLSSSVNFKGMEHIQPLLNSIEKNKLISFLYHKQFDDFGTRNIIPQFLKEYQNRWYLIGLDVDINEDLRIFGLDRISNLEIIKKLKYKRVVESHHIFDNMIGVDARAVNTAYNHPISIEFKVFEKLPHYFKSLPLHKSQKIIKTEKDYTLFSVELFVNYELLQHFFMYSPFIQVVEPKWLAIKMKTDLEKTIGRY